MGEFRRCGSAVLAVVLAAACGGFAFADPPPWAHANRHALRGTRQDNPRSHGVISGTVVGIDYGSASILVATPRGMVPVAVTPSTSIFRGSGFESFADIGRGAHVDIDVTDVGGRLIAQIIRIH